MQKVKFLDTSFSGQTLLTLGSTIFIFVLGFFTSTLAARMLGPVGVGELAIVQLWGAFFAAIALFGIPEAIVYFVGKEPNSASRYIITGPLLSLLVGLPLILVAYLFFPSLLAGQRVAIIDITRWYTIGLFILFALTLPVLSVLRGIQAVGIWNVLRPVPTFGWLLVLLTSSFFHNEKVEFLAFGFLISYVLTCLITFVIVTRQVTGPYHFHPKLWSPLLKFGLPNSLALIPNYLAQSGRLSLLIVSGFLLPEALGFIALAISWSNIIAIASQSIGQVIFPRIAALNEGDERRSEVERATRLTGLSSGILALVFLMITPIVIPLIYGSAFGPAIAPAEILLLAAVPSALCDVIGAAFRGMNRPTVALISELLSLFSTLLLLPLLVPLMGAIGVALAILISELMSTCIMLIFLSRSAQVPLLSLLIPTRQDFKTAFAFAMRVVRPVS